MPDPRPGEGREEFLDRCIPMLIDEGREPDQAIAVCISMYDEDSEEFATKQTGFNVDEEQKERYFKAFEMKRVSYDRKYSQMMYRAMKKQLAPLERATNVNELDIVLSEEPIKEAFVELYTEVGDAFARQSYQGLKNEPYPHTKQLPKWIERMRKYALVDASARIVEITKYTKKQINRIIVAGLEQGLSFPQIQRLIMGTPGLPPLNGTLSQRALRIARTEIVSASNAGSLEGALSTGLEFDKQWLATRDDRTRDSHADADGQTVNKQAPFLVAGEQLAYPGDPRGRASNVINCRCTQVYVTY